MIENDKFFNQSKIGLIKTSFKTENIKVIAKKRARITYNLFV